MTPNKPSPVFPLNIHSHHFSTTSLEWFKFSGFSGPWVLRVLGVAWSGGSNNTLAAFRRDCAERHHRAGVEETFSTKIDHQRGKPESEVATIIILDPLQ